MDIDIRDERFDGEAAGQYTLLVDGTDAGEVNWRMRDGRRAITHTGVRNEFRNQGLAGRLMARTLDDARTDGVLVLPFCSYAAQFIDANPEYVDLLGRTA